MLDLKAKAVIASHKAPMHVYDAAFGDSPETLFAAGFGKVAAFEIKG